MEKDEQYILTESMVSSATALGVHIVKKIALNSLEKQPNMTLNQFIAVLDNYSANVKETQEVKTTIVDPPVKTTDVIAL